MPDLVVRGGQVVAPEGSSVADIAVEDGRISAIAPELPGARNEIDARGFTVLPGLIDVHVHFNEPGRAEWEGAATGSRALASGGGTLFFDMPLNSSPCTVGGLEFDAKRAALERASVTDFALWGGIIPGNRGRMEELARRGAIGFKAFMADSGLPEFPRVDDAALFDGMREAARLGLPVAVHAENDVQVRELSSRARQAGCRGIRDYLDSRPVAAEVEAIARAARLAKAAGARLHIVHISSGSGVAAALEARSGGVDISIETCAHYLYFTEEDVLRLGAVAKCAPPLRPRPERDALRRALVAGEIDIVGSDHSPAPWEMKRADDFFAVWGGIAGVEATLGVLLFAPLDRVAAVVARNPAARFAIAHKGAIAVGNDADFALVDLSCVHQVTRESLFQKHRLSPYVGVTFPGTVRRTILRGETVFMDGKIVRETRGRMVQTTYAASGIHA
jgi:allantoinase